MNLAEPIDTSERVEAAARLISTGHAGEAEALLKTILAQEPGHPDALNTYASLALARKDGQRALEILGPACTAYPDHPRLLANLGFAHFLLGRVEDAAQCLERAVARAPHEPRMRLALAQYCAAAGAVERAIGEIETVLRDAPDNGEALAQLGTTALLAGDYAKGEAALRAAAAADPENSDVLRNLSVVCGLTGRHDEAVVMAERANLRAPFELATQVQLARCRAMLGEFDAAADLCKRILVVAPDNLQATEIFARIAVARGAVESGISTLSQLVRRQPKNAAAILSLAGLLRFAGRFSQALTFADQALALLPDAPHAQSLKRDLLLAQGKFREAWGASLPPGPVPRVVVIPKRTTPIEAVLFGRFIAARDASVVCWAEPAVEAILGYFPGVIFEPRVEEGTPVVVLQGLPALFGIQGDRLPMPNTIVADAGRLERWRRAFADVPRPLIGVTWDPFPPGLLIGDLKSALAGRGTPISLATGPERHQLRGWPQAIDAGVHAQGAADLLAAIFCLDVVVGTDGLPLHLGGALAQPGVALMPAGHPWYFATNDRDRLLWYPSLIGLRQSKPGDWSDVLARLPALLDATLSRPEREA